MQIRVLTGEDVRRALPMRDAIEGMKVAFEQLSNGRATIPLRSRIDIPAANGVSFFMPAYLPAGAADSAGTLVVKTVSVFADNLQRGLPSINGVVQLLDAATGRIIAILDGATLTAIRTGAGSGAATDLLARPDSRTLAIFGSGVQARTQLEAVCTVRSIAHVRVFSPNADHARAFANDMAGHGAIPQDTIVAANPQAAVAGADVVCAATNSSTPVFDGRDLQPGTHVNAIGSYQPHVQELDVETICRSLLVVDSREAVLEEAGDVIIPLRQGLIGDDHIHAELGELVASTKPGRTSASQITCFKSCGVAVQDAIAAKIAYAEAERSDLGTLVDV